MERSRNRVSSVHSIGGLFYQVRYKPVQIGSLLPLNNLDLEVLSIANELENGRLAVKMYTILPRRINSVFLVTYMEQMSDLNDRFGKNIISQIFEGLRNNTWGQILIGTNFEQK